MPGARRSLRGALVRLELGAYGGGEDLIQGPVTAGLRHEEVRLGFVQDHERHRPGLNDAISVEDRLDEDAGRGVFGPGLVEEEVARAVEDRLVLVHLDTFGPVGVVPHDEVGPLVYRRVGELYLSRFG